MPLLSEKERQDTFIHALMTDTLTVKQFEEGIAEFPTRLSPKDRAIVDTMGRLCVALQKEEDIHQKVSEADAISSELLVQERAVQCEVAQLKTELANLKTELANLKKPEELPEQTGLDLAAIGALMFENPSMAWYTIDSYPRQCNLGLFNRISLPRFSARDAKVEILMDYETKFVRLPQKPETWVVQGNTKDEGKVIGVYVGNMDW